MVVLMDSGASYNFINSHVSSAFNLTVDKIKTLGDVSRRQKDL